MKVNLFPNKKLKEEHLDIYYKEMSPLIEEVVNVVEKGDSPKVLIGMNEKGEQVHIQLDEIYYFEYVERRNFAYLERDVYQVKESLSKLEEVLAPLGFVRVNKSNIINLDYIVAIKPEINMRIKAVMENDEYLVINRSYKAEFRKKLMERRKML